MNNGNKRARRKRRIACRLLAAGLLLPAIGAVAHADQSGTWTTAASGDWDDSNSWSGGLIANGTTAQSATFNSAITNPVVVNLGSAHSISGLSFTSGSATNTWTLSSNTNPQSVLTLAGTTTPTITTTSNTTNAIISAPLAGSQGLSIAFSTGGVVTLAGSNTFTGNVTLGNVPTTPSGQQGMLVINSDAALGAAGNTLVLSANNSNGFFMFGANNINLAHAVSLSQKTTISLNQGWNETISGNIGGGSSSTYVVTTGSLVGGSLTLAGNNTDHVTFQISDDTTLIAASPTALGTAAAIVNTSNGTLGFKNVGTYANASTLLINNVGIAGANSLGAGAVENIAGINAFGGPIVLSAGGNNLNAIGAAADLLTLSGAISSTTAAPLQKVGAATVALAGGNSYSAGTLISQGTLAISSDNNLGAAYDGSIAGPAINVNNPGSSYAAGATVVFTGGGGAATATPTISGGKITAISLNTSSGYVSNPTISFSNGGSGHGATAFAYVKGLITLDGGTLQTTAPITSNRAVVITANSGTIDTDGNADTFSGVFNGTGGLTVTSSVANGSLTLSASNTYSGNTAVSAGTLVAGSAQALSPNSAVTVDTTGTLDASAFANTVKALTVGSLGTLNLGVGKILSVTNAAAFGGTLNVTGSITGTPSLIELMSYSGKTGTFATTNVPSGYSLSYNPNGTELDLAIVSVGPANLFFTGSTDGTWNASTTNFTSGSDTVAYSDTNHDNVTFDDSTAGIPAGHNTGHFAVAIQVGGVSPGSVAVTGTTDYTFTGGAITGTGGLNKTGIGTLTLSNSNTYSGATTVSGGTLKLTASAALSPNTAVSIGNGASVVADNGGGAKLVLQAQSFSLTGTTGKLDLQNNALVLHNTDVPTVTALLKSGFNSGVGYWDGPGIDSSAAANPAVNGGYLTTLGVASGVTVDGASTTDVVVKYTYYGDADLSGTVDGTDYNQIDAHNGQSGVGWQNGDFNYDGVVDASDYTLIDNAYNLQGSGGLASPLNIVATNTTEAAGAMRCLSPAALCYLELEPRACSAVGGRK